MGPRRDLSSTFLNFIFLIVKMCIIVNMSNFNVLSKLKSQISSNKQDSGLKNLYMYWYKFNQLLLFVDNSLYNHIKLIYFLVTSHFDKEMLISYFYLFVNKYKTQDLFT